MTADHPNHDEPHWSRRGFLSPRGLGASAGGFLGAILRQESEKSPGDASVGSWCVSRRAMGCDFSVYLPPTVGNPLAAGEAALDEIDRVEDLLTVHRDSSQMAYVNQHAAERAVRVDGRLFDVLARSAEVTQQTGGAFDVAAGALVRAWGFLHGPERVPDDAQRQAALACSGMNKVELDREEMTVRFRAAGLEVNLGGIGKGYGLDQAMAVLREELGIECGLIEGGSSSVTAMGSPGDDGRGWLVGIRDPFDPAGRVATVRLGDRALGSAGADMRYFEVDDRRYGHVLDPRTGRPVEGDLACASVVAPDAATADGLATGLFVMGLDKAREFCQNHARIGALLVLQPAPGAQPGSRPRVVTFNLSSKDVNLDPGQDPPADTGRLT